MTRFLHTADWQIGRQYGRFAPDDAIPLAEARFLTVERIAALARERGVDAVLVAGDVFDAQTVSERTLRRLFNALAAFAGPWVLIPGNHDAALAESVWTRARRFNCIPPNVHLIDRPGVQAFPDIGLAVLGAPLTQRHTHSDLTEPFDTLETPPGLLRVGLAHGSVQGLLAEEVDSANPIAPDRARRARLDYLALGDWHGLKQIDERTWYSGTPEPDRFKSNAPGHVLEVEITAPGALPIVTSHAVARFRWHEQAEMLSLPGDVDRLGEALAALGAQDVLSLTLSGRLDLAAHQRLQALLGEAAGRLRSLQLDAEALRLAPTEEDVEALRADGYLGEVLGELRRRQEGEDEVAREALTVLAALLRERQQEVNA
ncbi:metallophosphoesterase family protein [Azohydromonas caseinilytica]|uniref:DNA repair exonuclease n=1 Tax=Azohydromonas caseinilytica TaxID=2728836 RepID=A0A848F6A3_9BURK|nr:DNA repair exonuclease [Azohydromonas caseinilytica]NML15617.1 DNA repair exonuclease [Azohydromonas caseinilytica]